MNSIFHGKVDGMLRMIDNIHIYIIYGMYFRCHGDHSFLMQLAYKIYLVVFSLNKKKTDMCEIILCYCTGQI